MMVSKLTGAHEAQFPVSIARHWAKAWPSPEQKDILLKDVLCCTEVCVLIGVVSYKTELVG